MLDHVAVAQQPAVITAMERALEFWLGYRDGVAEACGVTR
jgi:hypothetical protein